MKKIRKEKIWEQKFVFGDAETDALIADMAQALGVSELFAVLLYNRGFKSAEEAKRFLRFEESNFHNPYLLTDMERAVERILRAVSDKEKIYIYGDYDVDGVTSVSILYLYLTGLGAEVGIKIPKREGEGYGVSCAAIDKIAEEGATLIITVDTGITANAEVDYAKTLGVDFVITDHHECHGELPSADAVVNPHRPDCEYPFKELAGVGVIFKVICACEMHMCKKQGVPVLEGVKRICARFADLVAVGTIADVMPLVDENRLIVSMGLAKIERGDCIAGLSSLLAASYKKDDDGGKIQKITSGMIGFGIAPKINAAGRISDAQIAVDLLLATDPQKVEEYTGILCEINTRRQTEENRIAVEAYEMLEGSNRFDNDKVLVLDNDKWQQGIIGIVSSRITEAFGLPSILISFAGCDDDSDDPFDDGKGSGRSIKGMNLVDALTYCSDTLVKYGGHELAAGLTVKRGMLDEFRKKINEYADKVFTEDMFKVKVEADCELQASDLTLKFAKDILRLEPFGVGNASPVFLMKNVTVKGIRYMGGGKHSRFTLEKDGEIFSAVYFGVGSGELDFDEGDSIDLLFNLGINEYKNVRKVQLTVQDIKLTAELSYRFADMSERYDQIHGGDSYLTSENIFPTRDDFARVYTVLRREFRNGTSVLDRKSIMKMVNSANLPIINHVKLKYIFLVFTELRICEIDEIDKDIYKFNVFFNASKTNIDKSSILKKLKGQCADRVSADS